MENEQITERVCLNAPKGWKEWLLVLLYIVFFITLGIICLDQGVEFLDKADIINDPCGYCVMQNPHLSNCIQKNPYNDIDFNYSYLQMIQVNLSSSSI